VRIAFVAGSLERGTDGVGDYTRWLAAEAARHGASCRLLAIADRHVSEPVLERDPLHGEIMRLPFGMPWAERLRAGVKFLDQSPPDWVSLQFVPYSFHKRGFAGALVRAVPELVGRARLHVMLHEIWIDGARSFRKRLVSTVQRRAILRLCQHPRAVIDTSNATYQQVLREYGIRARVLPLFGSIPLAESDATAWLAPRLAEAGCDALSGRRQNWWLFVLFGTLHPVWPPQPLLKDLEAAAASAGKRIALISAGRLGAGEPLWNEMSAAHGSRIPMLRLGEQPAGRISELLQTVDFGIATTPLALIGKSATVAAMFDHGLPVVVNREDGRWPASPATDPRESALVIRMGRDFEHRLRHARRLPAEWRLHDVARLWSDELKAAGVSAI
jgi:hypothetical protein